jgi:hypothetical protein
LLLRIDDIVSGTKKQSDVNAPPKAAPEAEAQVPEGKLSENFPHPNIYTYIYSNAINHQ